MRFLVKLLTTVGFVVAGLLLYATSAHAATFTVTSTGDDSAVAPAAGCATVLPDCTLRSAIEAANAQAGADTIEFNISGAGVHTFTPASDYDNITEQVTIDGSTQTGASCGTLVPASLPSANTPHTILIEVDGSSVNHVFSLAGNDITLRGLNIHNGSTAVFSGSSISNVLIECNYIGTNPAGTVAAGGTVGTDLGINTNVIVQNNLLSGTNGSGAYIYSSSTVLIQNNLVGTNATGTSALGNIGVGLSSFNNTGVTIHHNVVAGNGNGGILDQSGNQTVVTGNFIGLGVTGSPVGNTEAGLTFFGSNNFTVGGTTASARNIISANTDDGLHIYSDCNTGTSNDSTTYGNYIGTNTSGAVDPGFGNQAAGVEINEYQGNCETVSRHKIGGDISGQANIIAGNTGQGLLIHQDGNHDVFSITAIVNSVYSNGQFGIDLAADSDITSGVANVDLGPNPINMLAMTYPTTVANYYINTITINSTTYVGNQVTVNYTLQANAAQNSADGVSLLASDLVGYRLDFYVNDAGQDGAYAGYSQGKTHLGSFIVNGSETGANHTFTSPVTLASGQVVTATTTALWTNSPGPAITPRGCDGETARTGDGPPYDYEGSCPN